MVLFLLLLLTLIDLVPSFTTSTTIKVSTLLLLRSFNHRYSKSSFVSSSKIGASSSQKSAAAVSIYEKCDTLITMESRKKAALYGLFVADATAMPVHWYYDVTKLRSDYGQIKGYVKPKDSFPGSIMNLSNTGGGRYVFIRKKQFHDITLNTLHFDYHHQHHHHHQDLQSDHTDTIDENTT